MAVAPVPSHAGGRQRVLEAAQRLFAEGCYPDIGVAQILEHAGVQAPTLYHHFGDKEGLFVAWVEQAFGRITEAIHRVVAAGLPARDGLCAYGMATLAHLDFDLQQILRDSTRLARPESKDRVTGAYMRAIYEPLATLLVQAVATRELRSEPIADLADTFLGGLLALRRGNEDVETRANHAAWWCEAFVRAFRVA